MNDFEKHSDVLDRYRGKIVIKDNNQWRWCHLAPGYETVALKRTPNRHLLIQRIDGAPITCERWILQKGPPLSAEELKTIDAVKHGIVPDEMNGISRHELADHS